MVIQQCCVSLLLLILQVRNIYSEYSYVTQLRDELSKDLQMYTGDVYADNGKTIDINSLSYGELKELQIKKSIELKCSCLFFAHFHFSIAKELYRVSTSESIERPTVDAVSFVEAAEKMVRIFYSIFKIRNMYEIWLVYDLAWQMQNTYHPNVDILKGTLGMHKKLIVQMHKFVIEELDKFFELNCDSRNSFYIKSDSCKLNKEYNKYIEHISADTLKKITELLQINKFLFDNFYDYNLNKSESLKKFSKEINEPFSSNVFYKKYDKITADEVEKLSNIYIGNNAWEKMYTSLISKNKKQSIAQGNELNPAKYFGTFYYALVDIFKLVMLRFMWTLLDYKHYTVKTIYRDILEKFRYALCVYDSLWDGNIDMTIREDMRTIIKMEYDALATSLNLSPLELTKSHDNLPDAEYFANKFLEASVEPRMDPPIACKFKSFLNYKDIYAEHFDMFLGNRSSNPQKSTLTIIF